jgi:hypothetical protein
MNSTPSNVVSSINTPNTSLGVLDTDEYPTKPHLIASQTWSSAIPPPVPSKDPFETIRTNSFSASSTEPQYVAYNPFKHTQDPNTISSAPSASTSGPFNSSVSEGKRPIGEASTAGVATSYSTSCENCNTSGRDVQYCNVCESSFCAHCWSEQFAHKRNKLGPGGIPHEKTRPGVAEKVRKALAPPVDDRVREQMYSDDAPSSWFGIYHL